MDGAKLKALKEIFPELRNFEGRFFGLFLEKLAKEVEDWAIWARLELGKRKCTNIYTTEVACLFCKHFPSGIKCAKNPSLGQSFDELTPTEGIVLRHPNTGEWYWCIKECPDYCPSKEICP
jgi:hypothetical protein